MYKINHAEITMMTHEVSSVAGCDLTFFAALQDVVGFFQCDASMSNYQILSFSHGLEKQLEKLEKKRNSLDWCSYWITKQITEVFKKLKTGS